MLVDPNGTFVVSGTIAAGYASYAVAGMIASGILYYGAPIAADIGQSIGRLLTENSGGTIYVDPKGNAIPTPPGGGITGSPDGEYVQGRDANGNPTGIRKDGGHNPAGHPDPRAQQPHGHVPGVTNIDGTPWLPVNQMKKGY